MRHLASTKRVYRSHRPSAKLDLRRCALVGAVVVAGLCASSAALAQAQPPAPDVREIEQRLAAQEARLQEQDARLKAQEARLREQQAQLQQQQQVVRPPPPPPTPFWGIGPDGLFIGPKETLQVRIRALLQADGRAYFDTNAQPIPDQFVIRRARPILEGTIANFVDFRLQPDFGQGTAVIQDAFIDVRLWPFLALRGGKFKSPFGLERLQHDAVMAFMERGLPSDLVPDRDVGASLHGDIASGSLLYELAVFDGTTDGANTDGDSNDGKDVVARLFSHPLRVLKKDIVKNLGLGFGATYGKQHGTAANPNLPIYKTTGQITFFSYLFDPTAIKPTVIAIGNRYRLTPQLYWYAGPIGLLAEYVYSATTVTTNLGTTQPRTTLAHQAWQIEAQAVLTGEHAGYNGVKPKRPFSLKKRHFGALEVAARYGELRIDPTTFAPIAYADPTKSASQALEWGVGINWYVTDMVKLVVNYERTTFKGGASGGGDRRPENLFAGRLQVYF